MRRLVLFALCVLPLLLLALTSGTRSATANTGVTPVSPAPDFSFAAHQASGVSTAAGAVSPYPDASIATSGFCLVTAANSSIRISEMDGDLIANGSLQQFFNLTTETVYGARITYSQARSAFIVTATQIDRGGSASRLLVAVSRTMFPSTLSDTEWKKGSFDIVLTGQYGEVAGVGFDDTNVYVTLDMFNFTPVTGPFTTNRVAIFPWSTLTGGGGITTAPTLLSDLDLPAQLGAGVRAYHLKPIEGDGGSYLISAGNTFANTPRTGFAIFPINKVARTIGAPIYTPTQTAWGTPPFATEGSFQRIPVYDHLEKVVALNGNYYTAQTVARTGGGGFLPAVRFYRITGAGVVDRQFTLEDPNEGFYFPSVAPDPRGNVTLAFQGSGFNSTHSIYHARYVNVGSGAMETPRVSLTSTFSYGVVLNQPSPAVPSFPEPWGRYTDIVLDPFDDEHVYSHGALTLDSSTWRTVVQRVPNRNMQVLAPNGGEVFKLAGPSTPAQSVDICWPPGSARPGWGVRIELARDGVNFNEILANNTPDDGLFTWQVTGPVTLRARVRITLVDTPAYTDTSDADFTIADPNSTTRTVTHSPGIPIPDNFQTQGDWIESSLFLPGDLTIHGISLTVNITHPYIPDLQVYLVHPDGTSVVLHNQSGQPQTGPAQQNINRTYPAPTAPDEGTQNFLNKLLLKRSRLWDANGQELPWKLRVRDLHPTSVGRLNGWSLTVTGPPSVRIKLTKPNGGERYQINTMDRITWVNDPNNAVQGDVRITLDRNGDFLNNPPGDQTVLNPGPTNVPVDTGVFNFIVPGPPTTTARVRIESLLDPIQFDESDAVFSILNPFVRVTFPNGGGGQEFFTGETRTITWDRLPANQPVKVELTRNASAPVPNWEPVAASVFGTSFDWTVTGPDTADAKIRVTSLSDGALVDVSDNPFKITRKRIEVTAPAAGGILDVDKPDLPAAANIKWNHFGVTGSTKVELTRDANAANPTWEMLDASELLSNGGITWRVTGPPTTQAKIRVTSLDEPSIVDESDVFTIRQAGITVTSPTAGDQMAVGKKFRITWTSTAPLTANDGTFVRIEVQRGQNNWETIVGSTPNDGDFVWNSVTGPPNPPNQNSRVRITSITYPSTAGVSTDFKISAPSVRVVQPDGGEGLGINQKYSIRWDAFPLDSTLNPSTVTIQLSRDGGQTWEAPIISGTPNDGAHDWNVTGPPTTNAKIRVSVDNGVFQEETDTSNGVFRIDQQQIQVTEPHLNEKLFVGTSKTIQWSAVGVAGTVRIEVHRPNEAVQTLATNLAPNLGSYTWDSVSRPALGATVKVVSEADGSVFGVSDSFDIVPFGLTITAPTGTPTWGIGVTRKIRWTFGSGFPGNAEVYVRHAGDPVDTLLGSASAPGGNGSLDWTVDGPAGQATITVRVPNTTPSQEATATVDVVDPAITVTAPGANAELRLGQQTTITWNKIGLQQEDGTDGTVNISVSRSGGAFTPIPELQGVPNSGSAVWTPSGPDANNLRIRVQSVQLPNVFGVSGRFGSVTPTLVVTKPLGGNALVIGQQTTIEWTATGITGPLTIEIQRNGGAWETLFTGVSAAAGSQAWQVTGDAAGNGSQSNRIRIRSENPIDTAEGQTVGTFAIVKPEIIVGTPNGGQSYLAGTQQTITWSSKGIPAEETVKIELLKGSTSTTIAESTPNDGSHAWAVPANASGTDYRIRITRSGTPAASDTSDSTFAVLAPNLVVTSPNGGGAVRRKRNLTIKWTGSVVTAGGGGLVDVYLSRNGGRTWTRIISGTANDGEVIWKVTGAASSQARIKVEWKTDPNVNDTSDRNFRIQ